MTSTSKSSYTCSLSPVTLDKAKKELNEDPETRLIEVNNLKLRIEKIPGLQPRTDTPFLLQFLRARKFNQERALQLFTSYNEVRRDNPDIFTDLKPSRIKHVIDNGIMEVLSQRNTDGCRVIIIRPGKWNPDHFPMIDIIKTVFLILSKLLQEEETQVHGVHLINNLEGVTWKQASHLNPSVAKRFTRIIQDCLPLRVKRFDYVNEPTFFDIVFTIVKTFLKDKLVKRIVLNGSKCHKIHEVISPDHLPTDLGGKLPLYSNKEWMDSFLASDALFEENNKFGFVKMGVSKNQNNSRSGDADIEGLGGTFKKLDV